MRAFEILRSCFHKLVVPGLALSLVWISSNYAHAQVSKPYVQESLAQPMPDVASREYQLQKYLFKRFPPLPVPATPALWSAEEERVRKHVLDDIAYHGWPREWVDAPPKFEEVGVIETNPGYRIHKLRFEVVPGLFST